MACEPNDLISLARCFNCLSPSTLLEVQTYLLCQIMLNGGGGGGGATEVFAGNGLAPDVTPTATAAIWIDKDSGVIIHWYDGAWHI